MTTRAIKPRKPTPRETLTPKQRAFSFWMVSAVCYGNGTESARRAGYQGDDNVLGVVAYENLRKPKIVAEIQHLEAAAFKGADVTIEKVLRDLELQRRHALSIGQFAPAVRCSELQGKYLKMWVDKIEHVQTIEDVSTDELVRLLHEIAESGQIDLARLLAEHAPEDGVLSPDKGNKTTH
jgi:hypothetical protein